MLGLPVVGSEFFDREALMKDLKRTVPHAHHALIGPRGCGKSSILQQLAELGAVGGLTPTYIDVGRVVPRSHRNVIKKLGREVLYTVVRKKGVPRSMPALAMDKVGKVVDFVRENLRVRIGDWITLYFDPSSDLTELMETTFSTIESYGVELLVMLDEVTSLVRLSGPQPKEEDMDFMEALRGHISGAKHARYILSGSQVGLMNLIVKLKFGRMLVPKRVEGLDEAGADELIHAKINRKVSNEFVAEIKKRTLSWPLYIQAFCLAANLQGKPESLNGVEKAAFDLLSGHFMYLEGQLSEYELMTLLVLDGGKVSDAASRLEIPYNTLQSILRTIELKGFVKKTSPGAYESIDPMFSKWLRQRYEPPEAWK